MSIALQTVQLDGSMLVLSIRLLDILATRETGLNSLDNRSVCTFINDRKLYAIMHAMIPLYNQYLSLALSLAT